DSTAFPEPLVLVDGLTSFPSGHAGAALAIAAAFCLALRRSRPASAVLVAGLAAAVRVRLSRLCRGVHSPRAVLASLPVACAGLAVGCGRANPLVPAGSCGVGWQQEDSAWHAAGQGPAAEESPVAEARPDTARVP